jgi:thiamine-monophosphate kinase
MDTSDGAIATMDELMTRNGVGLRIEAPVERWTDPAALAVARAATLPPWFLHAGPHGEFELLVTVPPDRTPALEAAAEAIGGHPIRLGGTTTEPGLVLPGAAGDRRPDTTAIRNLFAECGGNAGRYVAALGKMLPEA